MTPEHTRVKTGTALLRHRRRTARRERTPVSFSSLHRLGKRANSLKIVNNQTQSRKTENAKNIKLKRYRPLPSGGDLRGTPVCQGSQVNRTWRRLPTVLLGALTKGSQGLLCKSLLASIDSYLHCRPSVNKTLKTKTGKST